MRAAILVIVVVSGILLISHRGETQETPSVAAPKSTFLDHIKVGERIFLKAAVPGPVTIRILTRAELEIYVVTEEERRQYAEVTKFLREQVGVPSETALKNMSDELKRLREKHESLNNYIRNMEARIKTNIYTVSRVGEDFIAYRDEDREVFLPVHQIRSIARSIPAKN